MFAGSAPLLTSKTYDPSIVLKSLIRVPFVDAVAKFIPSYESLRVAIPA